MQRVEWTSTNEIDGKLINHADYFLSHEERDHLINTILKNYKEEKVREFIDRVEMHLSMCLRIFHYFNPKSHADQIQKLDDMIKTLEAASDRCLQILAGRVIPIPPRQCNFLVGWRLEERIDARNSRGAINFAARRNARAANEALQGLIENLRSARQIEKAKQGRPKADELDLAFAIAEDFKKFVGAPRPHTGPFQEVCEYCFDILENKIGTGNDRTRAIRQALKKLSSYSPPKTI